MKSFYIKKVHSTRHMDYYDIYLKHSGQSNLHIESVYTNVKFDDQNRFLSGSSITNIFTCELNATNQWVNTKVIAPGFNGVLRLEIPNDSQISNNFGFLINFEDNKESNITIHLILLNNKLSKPKVLLPYGATCINSKKSLISSDSISSLSLDIISPYFLNTETLKPVQYNNSSRYLLVQNISENKDKKDCMLFTSKPIYSEGESINISFANIPQQLDTNISPMEILMYRPDDVPGITRSVDWVAIKFLDRNLGPTNAISFPVDGERNVVTYPEGEYIIRLMYKYSDLCPPVKIKVTKPEKITSLLISPPPPGAYCIYKICNNINKISPYKFNNNYLTIAFTANNQLMDLLVETLFLSNIDRKVVEFVCYINMKQVEVIKDNSGSKSFIDDYTQLLSSYVKSLLYSAFNNTVYNSVNDFSKGSENTTSHDLVMNIKNYITHNISEPITIESLANQFYFSKSHITHLFKRITGVSVNKYISQTRILKAKELLAKSDMSITQIAHALNYSDIHSFSHKFKKETGQSPSQYRNDYRTVYSIDKKQD